MFGSGLRWLRQEPNVYSSWEILTLSSVGATPLYPWVAQVFRVVQGFSPALRLARNKGFSP